MLLKELHIKKNYTYEASDVPILDLDDLILKLKPKPFALMHILESYKRG